MEKAYSGSRMNRLIKVFLIASFVSLTMTLILIWLNSPAKGYELSIYAAIPSVVWILLVFVVCVGITVIVFRASQRNVGSLWLLGFFLLILVNIIVLSLQFARGYYSYGWGDPFYHIRVAQSIATDGSIGSVYYPATHIIGGVTIEVLNLPSVVVVRYLPVFFSVVFMVFTYLLTLVVSGKKEHAILAAAASSPLLFIYYQIIPYPHALSILLFPMVFYAYFSYSNKPSISKGAVLVVLLFLFPFIHPVPEIILITCLLVVEVGKVIWSRRMGLKVSNVSFVPFMFSSVAFLAWISSFDFFGSTVRGALGWEGEISRLADLGPVFELPLWQMIELALKMYGHIMIFGVISLVGVGIITWGLLRRKSENQNYFLLSVAFITGFVIYFIVSNSLGMVTWGRFLGANLAIWATPPLLVFVFMRRGFLKKSAPSMIGITVIVGILVISSIVGIFGVYRSPWISQPNWQVTNMDISGSNWFGQGRESGYSYAPMGWLVDYPYVRLPNHFGYDGGHSLGEVVDIQTYILVTDLFKQAAADPTLTNWVNVQDAYARPGFDQKDFVKIHLDDSVCKLYASKEFQVFLAYPAEGS
jgi:hypothetical protein